MTLPPGSRLGVYEVTEQIGAGGMGEVYRATDSSLKRSVAIKVLPASVAGDADRLARFQREAEVLAALNHPNIAAIYGLEKTPDFTALVMELVEGEDLSQRLVRGAIPIDEALTIAKQIAEALEAAHERGIVHRDLKPANLKVRADGTVKVLDFGLAKATESPAASSLNLSMSPTMMSPAQMSGIGVILGTAAYMAPEQAKGRAVDRRADIWAFGVVLYEMLTGKRLFDAEDVSETLAAVLTRDVRLTSMPAEIPPRLHALLRDCLVRDPKQRLRDIGDARLVLDRMIAGVPDDASALTPATAAITPASSRALPWALAAAATIVAIGLAIPAVRHLREASTAATSVASLNMDLAPAERLGPTTAFARPSRTAFAIAPDGATVVFAGETTSGGTMLYRRPLAEAKAVVIPGTQGAEYPFFSPDGQWVGFAAGAKLKKVALGGGPPIELCDMSAGNNFDGASWGTAGVIVFSTPRLRAVSESGGTPEDVVPGTRGLAPALLPDGQTVLFTDAPSSGKWDISHVDALNLKTKQRKTLLTNAADARYSPTGHLIFMRNATLLAVPFDASRVEIIGAAVPLLAGVMQSTNAPNSAAETGMGQFAISTSGTLVYAAGDINPTRQSTMVRVDRTGAETQLADVKGALVGLRLSPSGSRVVAFRTGDGSRAEDLWLYELPSGSPTRLTSTGEAGWPLFSPDGKSVTFRDEGEHSGIYSLLLGSRNAPQLLIDGKDDPSLTPASWSADGKWLAYLGSGDGSSRRILVRAARDSKLDDEPRQFSPSAFAQSHAEFSPDGHWIAYVSNESSTNEVYVQPFPGPGEKHRVSASGGSSPAWARNGRELFFLSAKRERGTFSMFVVEVSTAGDFHASTPRLLFEGRYSGSNPLRSYDVTPDGAFIMSRNDDPLDQAVTGLHVVLGWGETLKQRVPVKK